MDTQFGFTKLSADAFRQKLREAETGLNGHMPLFFFDNHDNPRSSSRYGDGTHNPAIAKLLATLLLTPRCAALLYYARRSAWRITTRSEKRMCRSRRRIGWPKDKP